jgi:hypothetical protein
MKLALNSKRHIKQTRAAWKLAKRARQWKSIVARPKVAVGAITTLFLIES